jgi:steroid delta-isomerase-like uncharacterized protein
MALAIVLMSSTLYAEDVKSENKIWVEQFYSEFMNKGNLKLLDKLVADDYVEHEPIPEFELNKKGLHDYFKMMFIAFPDFRADIDFMIEEGNRVVVYLTYKGTHKGNYMGLKGSGKKIEFKAVDIIRVKDGKMTEHWGVLDVLGMLEQLGMVGFK